MADHRAWVCQTCGNVGLVDGSDGFFYCLRCNSQADDLIDTAVDEEDLFAKGGEAGGGSALYLRSHQRSATIKPELISQYDSFHDSQSKLLQNLGLEDETPQPERKLNKEESNFFHFDGVGPSVPEDFAGSRGVKALSIDDYCNEIRIRYVMGLQLMIELQCEALVKEFKVTPLICGLIGPIWLRFVSTTGVFDDDWAEQTIRDSEMQQEEEPEDIPPLRAKYRAEPHNMYNQRAVMIWFRSLRKRIPLTCTVAISLLACHVAREAVLPTDITKWTQEGKLPYFSAFIEIERRMGEPSRACPISSSVMFRPLQAVPLQKLESLVASIAHSIGLKLPPVNFYAIALRYLQKLSLPVEKILPSAMRIYEWSMPPELWLSTSDLRLPTRVCVMSILIVAIRILYNINGLGEWEKSLSRIGGGSNSFAAKSTGRVNGNGMGSAFASNDGHDFGNSDEDPSQSQKSDLDTAALLHHLHARYTEIADTHAYSKDLSTYLQYCKNVVFAGLEPSFENYEEKKMIDQLWNYYQKEKDSEPTEPVDRSNNSLNPKNLRDEGCIGRTSKEKKKKKKECFNERSPDDGTCLADDVHGSMDIDYPYSKSLSDHEDSETDEHSSAESADKEAIRKLKLDMEENKFYYIPPRANLKSLGYLQYVRKKDENVLTYVAHADYYILLRACARAAQVDVRIMHIGVMTLERRLAWMEGWIDHCLHLKPAKISCQFCSGAAPENGSDDVPELSNLRI